MICFVWNDKYRLLYIFLSFCLSFDHVKHFYVHEMGCSNSNVCFRPSFWQSTNVLHFITSKIDRKGQVTNIMVSSPLNDHDSAVVPTNGR